MNRLTFVSRHLKHKTKFYKMISVCHTDERGMLLESDSGIAQSILIKWYGANFTFGRMFCEHYNSLVALQDNVANTIRRKTVPSKGYKASASVTHETYFDDDKEGVFNHLRHLGMSAYQAWNMTNTIATHLVLKMALLDHAQPGDDLDIEMSEVPALKSFKDKYSHIADAGGWS